MQKNRGADLLARTLKSAGVERIFTLSGNHIMPVFDAALEAGIELIHVRHEAACVHMADACARLTGLPGVAMVTGGPGHANAVAALYTAQMGESPVLLLSGHAPNDQLGLGAFQEMRQADMAASVVKATWTTASADMLGIDVARAMQVARSGRPGPVNLNLPTDALEAAIGSGAGAQDAAAMAMLLADADAETIMRWLAAGRRPLVLTGPATMTRSGNDARYALEVRSGVAVVGMESPRGVNDPALGAFAQMLAQADRVLLVGKRVDFTLKFGHGLASDCEVMQIDADAAEQARARRAFGDRLRLVATADAVSALGALADAAAPAASGCGTTFATRSPTDRPPGTRRTRRWPGACTRLKPAAPCRPCWTATPTRCWCPTAANSVNGHRHACRRPIASSTGPPVPSAPPCRSRWVHAWPGPIRPSSH